VSEDEEKSAGIIGVFGEHGTSHDCSSGACKSFMGDDPHTEEVVCSATHPSDAVLVLVKGASSDSKDDMDVVSFIIGGGE